MSIAAVIPAYNCAGFIRECLDSVGCQTWLPNEVIVVDDHSDDDTYEVIADYGREHPDFPLKLLRAPANHLPGPAAVRNTGLSAATADWVAFLDSDDLWHPEHLARAAEVIFQHPEIVLYYCRADSFNSATGQRLGDLTNGPDNGRTPFEAVRLMLRGCAASTPGVVARRDAIERVGLFNKNLLTAQDWWLWILLSKVGLFAYDPRIGFSVRMYADSHTAGGCGPRHMLTGPSFCVVASSEPALTAREKHQLVNFWISHSARRLQHYLRVGDAPVLRMVMRSFVRGHWRERLRWLQVFGVAVAGLTRRGARSLMVRLKLLSPERQFLA